MILVKRDYRLVGGIVSVTLLWSGYMITQRTRGRDALSEVDRLYNWLQQCECGHL